MFRAIFRLLTAFKWFFTGQVTKATEHIEDRVKTQRAMYDDIIIAKLKQLNQRREAVSALMTLKDTKQEFLKKLKMSIYQLEKDQDATVTNASDIIASEGPEAKNTSEYQELQAIYQDQKDSLIDKEERQEDLLSDIESLSASLEEHKPSIRKAMRELEKVQTEKCQYIADTLAIKEDREAMDKVACSSSSSSSRGDITQKLEVLQDRRKHQKNYLKLTRELEGKSFVSEPEFELLTGVSE